MTNIMTQTSVIPKARRNSLSQLKGEFYPLQKVELIALCKAKLINNPVFVLLALKYESHCLDDSASFSPKDFAVRWEISESSVHEAIRKLKAADFLSESEYSNTEQVVEYRLEKLEQWNDSNSETGDIGIVYSLKCQQNARRYIGVTKFHYGYEKQRKRRFEALQRFDSHLNQLCKGCHPSRQLQDDWNNYGSENFVFEVLEIVPVFTQGSATLVWGSNAALRQPEAKWHHNFENTYSCSTWNFSSKNSLNSLAIKFRHHVEIDEVE